MAFKTVTSLDADTTISLGGFNKKTRKDNPNSVEGYYLGSRKVDSKKSTNGFAYIHFLQTPTGNLGVWGKTDLDRKLVTVTPGTMIRATHTGMQATPKGEMYKYKVETDDENTIEVNLAEQQQDNSSSKNDSDEDNSAIANAGASDEYDDEVDEDAIQQAALIAAEKKAKVQALLSRNKVKN